MGPKQGPAPNAGFSRVLLDCPLNGFFFFCRIWLKMLDFPCFLQILSKNAGFARIFCMVHPKLLDFPGFFCTGSI